MDIWSEIISIVVSNGVFAILFVWLFYYQLKDSAKREVKYQQTIEKLTSNLQLLEEVRQDLSDIKDYLKNGEEYEEIL
ncbi:MAG: bacteriocin [Clostridiales bacterium]|nr:bacteriocin [Clostridiales bacterium]